MFRKDRLFPSSVVPPEEIQATGMMKVVVVAMGAVGVEVRVEAELGVKVKVKVSFMINPKVRIEAKDAGVKVTVKEACRKQLLGRSEESRNPKNTATINEGMT